MLFQCHMEIFLCQFHVNFEKIRIFGSGQINFTDRTGDMKHARLWGIERERQQRGRWTRLSEAGLRISVSPEMDGKGRCRGRRTVSAPTHHARLAWLAVFSCDTRPCPLAKAFFNGGFRSVTIFVWRCRGPCHLLVRPNDVDLLHREGQSGRHYRRRSWLGTQIIDEVIMVD